MRIAEKAIKWWFRHLTRADWEIVNSPQALSNRIGASGRRARRLWFWSYLFPRNGQALSIWQSGSSSILPRALGSLSISIRNTSRLLAEDGLAHLKGWSRRFKALMPTLPVWNFTQMLKAGAGIYHLAQSQNRGTLCTSSLYVSWQAKSLFGRLT